MVASGLLGLAVILVLVVATVALVAGLVAVCLRALPPGGRDDATAWYDETASLAREAREAATGDPPYDADRLQRELLPIAARLRRQARRAPGSVDDRLAERTFALGETCQSVALTSTERVVLADAVEELRGEADDLATALEGEP